MENLQDVSDIQSWLNNQPQEVEAILAARAVLRAIPLANNEFTEKFYSSVDRVEAANLCLSLFRAASVPWLTAFSAKSEPLRSAIKQASDHTEIFQHEMMSEVTRSLVNSASSAAQLIFDEAAVLGAGTEHIRGTSNGEVDGIALSMIKADVDFLASGKFTVEQLALESLWHGNIPEDVREEWESLVRQLNRFNDAWPVWIEWYEARVRGGWTHPHLSGPENLGIEAARVLLDQKYWEEGPKAINSEIKRVIENSDHRLSVLREHGIDPETSGIELSSATEAESSEKPAKVIQSQAHIRENVPTHSDDPAVEDLLNRRPFASAIVEKMNEVRGFGGEDGFAVHLHGPWGSGKTSILNFMEEYLTSEHEAEADRWVVVKFNAWENERINPPWWPLLEAVNKGAKAAFDRWNWVSGHRRQTLRGTWNAWLRKTRWWPRIVFGILALAACVLFLTPVIFPSLGDWPKLLGSLSSVAAVIALFSKQIMGLIHGSSAAAVSVNQLSSDTMKPFKEVFAKLADATGQPVAIFIDDLDRCKAEYVVDLLEGIQTLFRHHKVAYVVAADRKWIRASFEQRYEGFSDLMGRAGQPLGYLFLEKIFQISTTVPGMGHAGHTYWKGLLDEQSPGTDMVPLEPEEFDKVVRAERKTIVQELGEQTTQASLDAYVSRKGNSSAIRAAAALELASAPSAQVETEHLLQGYKMAVPENPRGMKRIINAFGLRRAIRMLEASQVSIDALARWTIVEQRWPELADELITRPSMVEVIGKSMTPDDIEKLPETLRILANDRALLAAISSGGEVALSANDIRTIAGL